MRPLSDYVDWLRDDALPFWLNRGADERGLLYETLALDGTPNLGADLRLRTAMRQVYVFTHAAQLGLADRDRALTLARELAEHIHTMAWAPDGKPGWIARFSRDGQILDDRRDLYDTAFVLHALGHLRQATGDVRYSGWIDETMAVVDRLEDRNGGWAESDRRELPRRQNPHMHLFESYLALFETTREPRFLARAGEIFGLFRTHFFDARNGTLTEYFGPAWERDAAHGSHRLEPGHMAEWTWLLRRYQRACGHPVDDLCAALFGNVERLGLDASGFLVDEVDEAGHPSLPSRRLWPQTEYLKALVVQGAATGDSSLFERAGDLIDRLLASYLTGIPNGCWRDRFTLDGEPENSTIPASTLYHLFAPAVEILRLEQA